MARIAMGVVVVGVVLGATFAIASGPASAQQPGDATRAEARRRFDRGLELFNEQRYDAALAEFERAYELVPSAPALYNLGRVHAALGHAVEATNAFERYLAEGGRGTTAARRGEVQRELERQRSRIARLTIRTSIEGAIVTIDGIDVGRTPLREPVRVSAGRHAVGAHAAGYDGETRAVQVAGGVEETVTIELRPAAQRGSLRIVSAVPEVVVVVDGQPVGRTPLGRTIAVSAGRHLVEGRRAGYQTRQVGVDVPDGGASEVELELEPESRRRAEDLGKLRVRLPDAPYALRVDEASMSLGAGGMLELPVGSHDMELEVADRARVHEQVRVPLGGVGEWTPALTWTPEAREERLGDASTRRTLGWALTLGGLVVGGVGLGLVLWNEAKVDDLEAERLRVQACMPDDGTLWCPGAEQMLNTYNSHVDTFEAWRVVSIIAVGLGGAALVGGLVFVLWAPSDEDIDAEARAELGVGLGEVTLRARF